MTLFFYNAHNQVIAFTHQDQDLLEAYHKVKRFQITDMKDLRGLVINVRETSGLRNILTETLMLHGVPSRSKNKYDSDRPYIFETSISLLEPENSFRYPGTPGPAYINTMINYNIAFKFNAKVKAFIKLLEKADRFQQRCIIHNLPYTEENFKRYEYVIKSDMELDRSFRAWEDERRQLDDTW